MEQLLLALTSDSSPDLQEAFFDAIKRRSLREVMLLLFTQPAATRIEIEARQAADGQTSLHLAAASGDPLLASLLLERGADADSADTASKRAVDVAKEAGHSEVVALLSGGQWPDCEARSSIAAALETSSDSHDVVLFESSIDGRDLLAGDEIVRLKALCASQKAAQANLTAAIHKPLDATVAYTQATTKECPNRACRLPQTHYHGHACHHVREGCYSCKTHFCYSCLATAAENRRERGLEDRCKCVGGCWSNWCDESDLLANIVLQPYPHDRQDITTVCRCIFNDCFLVWCMHACCVYGCGVYGLGVDG